MPLRSFCTVGLGGKYFVPGLGEYPGSTPAKFGTDWIALSILFRALARVIRANLYH